MTVDSFKKDFPEYGHLQGIELWDMMERMMMLKNASEQREGDGPAEYVEFVLDGMHYTVDKRVLKFFETDRNFFNPTESYRFEVLDFSDGDKNGELISVYSVEQKSPAHAKLYDIIHDKLENLIQKTKDDLHRTD